MDWHWWISWIPYHAIYSNLLIIILYDYPILLFSIIINSSNALVIYSPNFILFWTKILLFNSDLSMVILSHHSLWNLVNFLCFVSRLFGFSSWLPRPNFAYPNSCLPWRIHIKDSVIFSMWFGYNLTWEDFLGLMRYF